jgi:hypothetical protein
MADTRSSTLALTARALGAGMLVCGAGALAQTVAPRAVDTPPPEIPQDRAGMPLEGWAIVRYAVTADGSTSDVRIVDIMPPELPDRGIRDAVEQWTFEPATLDGEAIGWYNNEAVLVLDAATVPAASTPEFAEAYAEADGLLRNDEHQDALRSNERLLESTATRLREIGLAQVQNAAIHIGLGDHHAAYAAILRATDPRVPLLDPNELALALQYRNVLELQLGDAEAALATFERRNALGVVADDDPVGSRLPALQEALAAEDSIIAISGRLIDEQWRHVPTRRTFALGDIDGSIETILVECDRRAAELEYVAESEYTLPESWGNCALQIEGRRNTTFRFYEFL